MENLLGEGEEISDTFPPVCFASLYVGGGGRQAASNPPLRPVCPPSPGPEEGGYQRLFSMWLWLTGQTCSCGWVPDPEETYPQSTPASKVGRPHMRTARRLLPTGGQTRRGCGMHAYDSAADTQTRKHVQYMYTPGRGSAGAAVPASPGDVELGKCKSGGESGLGVLMLWVQWVSAWRCGRCVDLSGRPAGRGRRNVQVQAWGGSWSVVPIATTHLLRVYQTLNTSSTNMPANQNMKGKAS